jgi:hypothetical protein
MAKTRGAAGATRSDQDLGAKTLGDGKIPAPHNLGTLGQISRGASEPQRHGQRLTVDLQARCPQAGDPMLFHGGDPGAELFGT